MADESRWILEELQRQHEVRVAEQDERRCWHHEAMKAYDARGTGISNLMMGWLVARTVVELAILVALVWR